MKPKTHLHLTQVAGILLGLSSAGMILGLGIYYRDLVVTAEWMFGLLFFSTFIVVPILFHTLVAPKIPAACPQCGSESYLTGSKVYTCSRCGQKTDLNLWGPTGQIGKKIHDVADKKDRNASGE